MTPAVAIMANGQVLGNFGREGKRQFKWIAPKSSNGNKEDNLPQKSSSQHKSSKGHIKRWGKLLSDSKEFGNLLKETNIVTDHSFINDLITICEGLQEGVQLMINELASQCTINDAEVERLMKNAVDCNDLLQGAITAGKLTLVNTKSKRKPENRKQRPEIEETRIKSSCKSAVQKLVEDKDVFCLICMLRGSSSSTRKEAAKGLESLAKKGEVRDEIKSAGGTHSLLNLFKSCSEKNEELKSICARAIAYLIPSFTHDPNHPHGSLELKVMDCLRYLFNAKNHWDERSVMEAKSCNGGINSFLD